MKSNGSWKWIAGVLAALLVVGLTGTVTAYFGFARDVVPRDDIAEMIAIYSPYAQDRPMILAKLTDISSALEAQQGLLDDVRLETARLSALIEAQQSAGG